MFQKGQSLKTTGLDLDCNEVAITVEFVRYINNENFDCVIKAEGISVMANASELAA